MTSDLILVTAGIAAAWVTLRIVGGERQRILQSTGTARPPSEPPADVGTGVTPRKPAASGAAKKTAS